MKFGAGVPTAPPESTLGAFAEPRPEVSSRPIYVEIPAEKRFFVVTL